MPSSREAIPIVESAMDLCCPPVVEEGHVQRLQLQSDPESPYHHLFSVLMRGEHVTLANMWANRPCLPANP